jgi:hypothetical protein
VAKNNGPILKIFAEKKRVETAMARVDQSLRLLFSNREKRWIDHLKVRYCYLPLLFTSLTHSDHVTFLVENLFASKVK